MPFLLTSVSSTSSLDLSAHIWWIVSLIVLYVLWAIALWRTFSKAGWPGILGLIPIVNLFILMKIAGYSAWWGLFYFVPIANIVVHIVVSVRVGRGFGHGLAFSLLLLWLFPFIGYFVLGFGDDTYTEPV